LSPAAMSRAAAVSGPTPRWVSNAAVADDRVGEPLF
jgi:hypothetical protein